MKAKTSVSILIFVLAVLLITGSCATAPKTKKREDVNQKAFYQSVRSGDITEVKRLIEEGADVDERDTEGWTALMRASQYGHPEVARLLIDAGLI